MGNKILILLGALIVTACQDGQKNTPEAYSAKNQAFDSLLENYYEEGLQLNPISATFQGDNRYNDTLPNFLSEEYEKQLRQYYTVPKR